MNQSIAIILTCLFLSACNSKPTESVITYSNEDSISEPSLVVKQYYIYENVAAYFLLVNVPDETKWDLMTMASQEIATTIFDQDKNVTKLLILYYDDEKIMPDSIESLDHLTSFITKTMVTYSNLTKENLIGYSEISRKKYSSRKVEVIQYPVKVLQNKAAKGITD